MKAYGFQFGKIISLIDRDNTKAVTLPALVAFIQQHGVDFSREEFSAVIRKVRGKD